MICRGNSFIYASGGINTEFTPNREVAERRYIEALQGINYVMKPGAFLYLDKYKDAEKPFKCSVGFDTVSKKDIIWYCNRKAEAGFREASIGLEDDKNAYVHRCDDLDNQLLVQSAVTAGFKVKEIDLVYEKNFSVFLLEKLDN